MNDLRLQDAGPLAGHSPDQERPLGGYATLSAIFGALVVSFGGWFRRSGRPLPDRMHPTDLALVAVATHKTSRLLAKSRAASWVRSPFTTFQEDAGPAEVDEAARGSGLRLAVGELLVCPFCLGMWFSALFAAGLLVAPRGTRQVAGALAALFGSDMLQLAYRHVEDAA